MKMFILEHARYVFKRDGIDFVFYGTAHNHPTKFVINFIIFSTTCIDSTESLARRGSMAMVCLRWKLSQNGVYVLNVNLRVFMVQLKCCTGNGVFFYSISSERK